MPEQDDFSSRAVTGLLLCIRSDNYLYYVTTVLPVLMSRWHFSHPLPVREDCLQNKTGAALKARIPISVHKRIFSASESTNAFIYADIAWSRTTVVVRTTPVSEEGVNILYLPLCSAVEHCSISQLSYVATPVRCAAYTSQRSMVGNTNPGKAPTERGTTLLSWRYTYKSNTKKWKVTNSGRRQKKENIKDCIPNAFLLRLLWSRIHPLSLYLVCYSIIAQVSCNTFKQQIPAHSCYEYYGEELRSAFSYQNRNMVGFGSVLRPPVVHNNRK